MLNQNSPEMVNVCGTAQTPNQACGPVAPTNQPFVIGNRPGAGSSTAAEVVANASPDRYALLVAGLANAVNATLYKRLTFSFTRDFVPVAGILNAPNLMVVNPSFAANTVPAFVAYAKANPSKVKWARRAWEAEPI